MENINIKKLWIKLSNLTKNIDKYILLRKIQKNNKILFYQLINSYIEELMPVIYTPTVGIACQNFSKTIHYSGGLWIPLCKKQIIQRIVDSITNNIKIIVITDGERVLGLGDQGIGGMNIVISKATLYTACAGINPKYILPVMLDVGSNNKKLLNDSSYIGVKKIRTNNIKYKKFINTFIKIVNKKWKNVIIHFEDFARENALYFLKKYKNKISCFNDDIQGTAVVVLSTLISALSLNNKYFKKQKIVIFGAGSAGCGIAYHLINYMKKEEGLEDTESYKKIFMIDKCGLLTDKNKTLLDFQTKLAQKSKDLLNWKLKNNFISLFDVIKNVHPTILIGVSGKPNIFSKKIILEMKKNCDNPIILPLSNPSSYIEAHPKNILNWTNGKAIIATGSPFKPIKIKEKKYFIPQCNNFYVFPGLCLGIILSKINKITDDILITVSKTLSNYLNKNEIMLLLPKIIKIQDLSKKIAFHIIELYYKKKNKKFSNKKILEKINNYFWLPKN